MSDHGRVSRRAPGWVRTMRWLSMMLVLPSGAEGQAPASSAARAGRVTGSVFDSVAHAPLAGGTVALVSVRDSAIRHATAMDSRGRFAFDTVAAGPWVVRVRHPRLDSLALRELVVPFDVKAGKRSQIALAVPSPRMLAQRACQVNHTPDDTSGFLLGTLRRAETGEPIAGGSVRVEWIEFVLTGTRPSRELITLDVPTDAQGLYMACGVPVSATVLVRATSASDSSGRSPLRLPASGIRYRDVFVGSGTGRLSGRVRDSRGQALANARVAIPLVNREVRTDTAGRFQFDGVPAGTHALEVRALGFDPLSDAVDVVANAEPVSLAMMSVESLDTVRVRASRARPFSRRYGEFDARRRMGTGTFFTSEDIDRINPMRLSDLFAQVGGIVMQWRNGERVPTMRGLTFRGRCVPIFIVDGFPFPQDASLDAFIPTMSVIGVEVYSTAFTPGEFSQPFAPCGTIVIWTGERPIPPSKSR